MNDIPCTYRISVKAIIKDDESRILLLREKDGSWELSGGGLEHVVDPKCAAQLHRLALSSDAMAANFRLGIVRYWYVFSGTFLHHFTTALCEYPKWRATARVLTPARINLTASARTFGRLGFFE